MGDINVIHSKNLKPFLLDSEIMPRLIDEVPILIVAACFCEGTTQITGASELRIKETDRLKVMATQLTKMGANIEIYNKRNLCNELVVDMKIQYTKKLSSINLHSLKISEHTTIIAKNKEIRKFFLRMCKLKVLFT